MTINEHTAGTGHTAGKVRLAGRFLWHYIEMVIAMVAGMMLLAPVWDAVLPGTPRFDLRVLIMAADMTIGMAVWMKVRRHGRRSIAEMSAAMVAPFVALLVPYWFGVVPGSLVMSLGHTLMFIFMLLVMLWRREEYTHHQHRFRISSKWVKRAAVVQIALLVPAAFAAVNTAGKFGARYQARADAASVQPAPKAYDPDKPTVAFVVSSTGSNAADLLGPYEVVAATGRFNTYVVSAGSRLVPLTGGLDLVPDMTFDELGRQLSDRHDTLDAVVIPALQPSAPAETASIRNWLRQESAAGALVVSVCNGARTLAGTGLLDGRQATSHWLRLPGLRTDFGKVDWVSGTRYVDDGNVITTAGVLSGIDGGLRIIERLTDVDTAREAAAKVHWRYYSPGVSAAIPQSRWQVSDAVVGLNASFQTGPSTIGVQLTNGVGELELASVFLSYTEQSMVGRTIAVGDGPIRSEHGLTFVPRSTLAAADGLDRLLVPGADAARRHVAGTGAVYLHTGQEFAFDPVLRDIARTYDVKTARWTAKTLEYPAADLELTGSSWPWLETLVPVALALLGAAGAAGAIATGKVFRRIRAARVRTQPIEAPAEPATI